ncbi:hypothetical protein AVEN_223450-1 [Araneus ventricosus]|uniref:Uncharacterized protein n=1 Tax=Araneus ventricosus TaxID=182803 RepID=A0A4Y2EPM4_ARAVE|nr:hypothetical protein AVEN_223450-1 [Araneus ventricosus]
MSMEEFEDNDFESFQQEMVAAEIEEITYLESSLADSSTNMYIFVIGGARVKIHYSYARRIDGADGGELDETGLRSTSLAKSKFALVVNDQFEIS